LGLPSNEDLLKDYSPTWSQRGLHSVCV